VVETFAGSVINVAASVAAADAGVVVDSVIHVLRQCPKRVRHISKH
jgi:hypothetical protein